MPCEAVVLRFDPNRPRAAKRAAVYEPEIEALMRQLMTAAAIKPHIVPALWRYTAEIIQEADHAS